jgi:hypothetical protein
MESGKQQVKFAGKHGRFVLRGGISDRAANFGIYRGALNS